MQEPIITYWDPPDNTNIKQIIYVNDKAELHRPWREGPALITYAAPADPADPALLSLLYTFETHGYYENGRPHRPSKEGPAITYIYKSGGCDIYYFKHGIPCDTKYIDKDSNKIVPVTFYDFTKIKCIIFNKQVQDFETINY